MSICILYVTHIVYYIPVTYTLYISHTHTHTCQIRLAIILRILPCSRGRLTIIFLILFFPGFGIKNVTLISDNAMEIFFQTNLQIPGIIWFLKVKQKLPENSLVLIALVVITFLSTRFIYLKLRLTHAVLFLDQNLSIFLANRVAYKFRRFSSFLKFTAPMFSC